MTTQKLNEMKTFGLFMLLFVIIAVGNLFLLSTWQESEIIILSTLIAYIMQQYFVKEIYKNNKK